MALALATSPARVTQNLSSSAVCAAFNPPAEAILLLTCASNSTGGGAVVTFTISNNGTALTWNLIGIRNKSDASSQEGAAAAYWTHLPSARTGMTVTCQTSSTGVTQKVDVITGADTADPIGGYQEGSFTTSSVTTTAFTTERASSLGFWAASQFTGARGAFTSSDTTVDAGDTANFGGARGHKTLGAAGSSATFNINGGGTGTVNWVAFEVREAVVADTGDGSWHMVGMQHHHDELAARRVRRTRSGLYVPDPRPLARAA